MLFDDDFYKNLKNLLKVAKKQAVLAAEFEKLMRSVRVYESCRFYMEVNDIIKDIVDRGESLVDTMNNRIDNHTEKYENVDFACFVSAQVKRLQDIYQELEILKTNWGKFWDEIKTLYEISNKFFADSLK